MERLIRPTGFLLFTTKGTTHAEGTLPKGSPELDAFMSGEIAVTDERVSGSNLCAAYMPATWVEESLVKPYGFEVLEWSPGAEDFFGGQEIWLLRRQDGA